NSMTDCLIPIDRFRALDPDVSRSRWSGSARGPFPGMPPSPSDPLALLECLDQRRLHHRARDGIPAHLEDRADQALDTEPGVLPGTITHHWLASCRCLINA